MKPEIIGSISDTLPNLSSKEIACLYHTETIKLSHGSTFTGKPVTQIHVDEQWVLKCNKNLVFSDQLTARTWCQKKLKQEKAYHIYHPLRTWMVLPISNGKWQIANLTPHLKTLHTMDWCDIKNTEIALYQLVNIYYRFSSLFDMRLDEGLSNFGLDRECVYYLDDDIFSWDDHISFVAMLCRWLRAYSQQWLTVSLAIRLGQQIRKVLLTWQSDLDVELVHIALKDQFFAEAVKPVRDALLSGLIPEKKNYSFPGEFWQNQPIGLLADIHANLPALQAVLSEMDKRGIQQLLVLGDIVGYGPDPDACIRMLRERNAWVIRGNHDQYIGNHCQGKVAMSRSGAWAAKWSMEHLDHGSLDWLRTLPVKLEFEDILAVHGAPIDVGFFNAYVYEMTYERNLAYMHEKNIRICLYGHTHLPGTFSRKNGSCYPLCSEKIQFLSQLDACLVNPGSVGQPRTGIAGADAAILDPATKHLELLHLNYAMEPLLNRMHQYNFPDQLIKRLQNGR